MRSSGRGAPVAEATTLGAAHLAGVAAGVWSSLDETTSLWAPVRVCDPTGIADRDRWRRAVERAGAWYPELSALEF
ncbi:MAG: hypothetical protein R2715_07175 [Ilumatobacteraceae bacterium]